MARSADQVHDGLMQLLPTGEPVWVRGEDTYHAALYRPLAAELAQVESSAEAMALEIDPRTAVFTLDAFERVLGPDPCGRDALALSQQDRAAVAWQRWTAGADVCAGYFVRLASSLGTPITIDEFYLPELGFWELGACDLAQPPEQFLWRVNVATVRLTEFELGAAELGATPLGGISSGLIECVIRAQAPAHTLPIFNYGSI